MGTVLRYHMINPVNDGRVQKIPRVMHIEDPLQQLALRRSTGGLLRGLNFLLYPTRIFSSDKISYPNVPGLQSTY